jgi:hypothetical protein
MGRSGAESRASIAPDQNLSGSGYPLVGDARSAAGSGCKSDEFPADGFGDGVRRDGRADS